MFSPTMMTNDFGSQGLYSGTEAGGIAGVPNYADMFSQAQRGIMKNQAGPQMPQQAKMAQSPYNQSFLQSILPFMNRRDLGGYSNSLMQLLNRFQMRQPRA